MASESLPVQPSRARTVGGPSVTRPESSWPREQGQERAEPAACVAASREGPVCPARFFDEHTATGGEMVLVLRVLSRSRLSLRDGCGVRGGMT